MAKSTILISHARLKAMVHYDPETGVFTALTNRQQIKIGQVLGIVTTNKHKCFTLDGKKYFSAALAWLYMTGEWPPRIVDHKDQDGLNDKWNNLRLASCVENARNSKLSKRNTSGHKGVAWNKRERKWTAQIGVGRSIHLGYFAHLNDAISARKAAEAKYFGEFAPS